MSREAASPLAGRTIFVTRAKSQANDLCTLLEESGAEVIEVPTIEITSPDSWESLDHVIDSLERWGWLIFTSTNGVDFFFRRCAEKGRILDPSARPQVAAVGASTAERLGDHGITPDVVPEKFQASEVLPLLPAEQHGVRTAVVRAEKGREELIEELRNRGGEVHLAVAYRTRTAPGIRSHFAPALAQGAIDAITFTSSSTAEKLFGALEESEREELRRNVCLASIGPVTTETLRRLGAPPACEAARPSMEALRDALVEYFRLRP
ncbi:MAG: uroporphyrinogen-III synthase [Thermoanaerobaculia bacterium]